VASTNIGSQPFVRGPNLNLRWGFSISKQQIAFGGGNATPPMGSQSM
jgi:hypothetical protein